MSIADQIRKQLEQPDGLTMEALSPLAAQYGFETEQVNARLAECTQLLRKGLRSEAIQRAFMKPNVLDWSARLDFPEFDDWLSILQFYGITVPTLLDRDAAQEIQEAIVDEQPLEELLRQHRRLAIAKAPLSWRLKVLRRLGEIDSINFVWREDQEQWETIRLKQIPAELSEAIHAKALPAVQSICTELTESRWAIRPPQDLCNRASQAADSLLYTEQSVRLGQIADDLHAAYTEGNESSASQHLQAWQEIVSAMRRPPPNSLVQATEPAKEWLRGCQEDRNKIAKYEKASASLEAALQQKTALTDLQRLYYDVVSLQMGVDPILEQRYESRVSELKQVSKRRLQVGIVSIALSAITIMAALGMWQWNRTYRKAIDDSSARLSALIEKEDLKEAESIANKLTLQAPQIANSPEITSLLGKLKAKQDEEIKRAELATSAIEDAQASDPEKIELAKLVYAEKLAKTQEEKAAVQKIRLAWDKLEQETISKQFDMIRAKVNTMEERLAEIQKMQLPNISETELQSSLIDLGKLGEEYPKGANRASKIIDLASERTRSLLDSVRKQRREVTLRQAATKGIREAKSFDMFVSETKRFTDMMPGDRLATEYLEALQEAENWGRVDAWNGWCKKLSQSLAGGLSPDELQAIVSERTAITSSLTDLPNVEAGVQQLDDLLVYSQKRSASLLSLAEDLNSAVLADLVTILEVPNSDSRKGSRRFMTWEARAENDEAIRKQGNSSRMVLPVVSDNLGATANVTFRGKFAVLDEPRATIRKIARRLETNQATMIEDWEGGLSSVMQDLMKTPDLDSQIKEILTARIIKTVREGSAATNDAFANLEETLTDRTEKRALWFNGSEMNDVIDPSVLESFRNGLKKMEALKRKSNESVSMLAANKLVWVGAMLRDSNGKVEAWLARDDVPNGTIATVVPSAQASNSSRVVLVGQVEGKKGTLQAEAEAILAGRPLYWIRPLKTVSN